MKNSTLWVALVLCAPTAASAQFGFTNSSNLLSNTTTSGGCTGVVDMNGDGLDDIAKLHNSRVFQVDYQNADGSFNLVDYGSVSGNDQWGMAIGDIGNDGHKDVVSGGNYDGTHYLKISAPGQGQVVQLNEGDLFTQCVNIADINNDGNNDYYACHDVGAPKIWLNDGNGNLSYNDYIDFATNPSSDMSGNYGSVWIDFDNDNDLDLYISHCRQGVSNQEDPRRWNRLFVNDGNNHFTDRAAEFGVQIKNQTWTADFGDIDNDGDLDMVLTNHDTTIQLFENDGTGHYTEITANSGLALTGLFLQSKFVDLDNNGYVDLMISGGNGSAHVFRNDGDKSFTELTGLFPSNKSMLSFATGDLNNDGFQDVFATYGDVYVDPDANNPDRLWMNNGNDNHWFSVRLQGTESNRDAIGARVTITGPWGTQIREVRAGESYGIVTSFAASFGLGEHTVIPSLEIRWPSGLVETFTNLEADRTITVIENTCISPEAEISTVAGAIVCGTGDAIALTANAGYDYQWSTGAQTQSINVSEGGNYTVTIDDGNGCTGVTSIFVQEDPDQTPTVTADGETILCEGQELVLTSTEANGYAWTGGATTQSITVTQSGTYSVTIDGACQNFTSAPITVEMLSSPAAPEADDVNIPLPGSAQLMATGTNNQWYDVATGGEVIGTGNVFNTPVVSGTTSFWVSDVTIHGGEEAFGGRTNKSAQGAYHTNADNYQLFTAYEPFELRSVKVYSNAAGNRTIAVIDQDNGTTVATGVFNIPNGESRVQLDFDIPASGAYALRVVGGNPGLWRDAVGSNPVYPYPLGTVGVMTSSSVAGANGTQYYYFFYDLEVAAMSTTCEGPRTEVLVTVGTVGVEENNADAIRLWPNPADDQVNITFGDVTGTVLVDVMDITGRSVIAVRPDAQAVHAGTYQLNVGALAQGDYLVRVRHNDGDSLHRVVVR